MSIAGIAILGTLSCTGDGSSDAGPPAFEGTSLGGGYTSCGSVQCQPGQSCREENLCYLGCERSRECAEGEICDLQPSLGGTCAAPDIATCGDGICSLGEHAGSCLGDCPSTICRAAEQGLVACGDNTCAPETYCGNPAEGLCFPGCISIVNCGCGRRCNASPGQPGTCTVPLAPHVPVCGDGVCEDPEGPRNCIDDCTWEDGCIDLCQDFAEANCLGPGQGFSCFNRCANSDATQQESFVFCVFLSNGVGTCPTGCLDELAGLFPLDAGQLP